MISRLGLLAGSALGMNPITLITGIKYTASLVRTFNNMTFLYDPNWEYKQGEPSYPIAFFFVKGFSEQMSSDVSQKPMLFYNTASDSTDSTKGGIMNIIADNVIIKPKTYKLDIIIPANGTALNNTFMSFENMASVSKFIATGSTSIGVFNKLSMGVDMSLNVLTTLFNSLYGSDLNMGAVCNALLEQQDYNKASIEDMWRGRRVLKLKLWNGWKFKYLIIKDFDVNKIGEDGDFYTGTLTCQEMPILTFRKQGKTPLSDGLSAVASFSSSLGNLQKVAVDTFVKAMETTLGA